MWCVVVQEEFDKVYQPSWHCTVRAPHTLPRCPPPTFHPSSLSESIDDPHFPTLRWVDDSAHMLRTRRRITSSCLSATCTSCCTSVPRVKPWPWRSEASLVVCALNPERVHAQDSKPGTAGGAGANYRIVNPPVCCGTPLRSGACPHARMPAGANALRARSAYSA